MADVVASAAGTALESWTRTEYDDVNRRVVVRSDIEQMGDGRKVAIQHFDQLGRVRLARTLEDPLTEDPYNETHGIKVETRYRAAGPCTFESMKTCSFQLTSNPFRAATSAQAGGEETMGWTLSETRNDGRYSRVQTFAGAALPIAFGGGNTNTTGVVTTETDANTTTVTDQAGKKRRSVTNALGQLVRVDEPDDAGQLGSITAPHQPTFYSYDALGNLTEIVQGGQTRTFTYSSMSRLLTSTNPESGTFQYSYDPNGNLLTKTDARGVSTTYTYDAQNRVTFRDYSDTTPDVTYTYDDPLVPFSKGKLTKIASPASTIEYTGYDAAERIIGSKQTTAGNTFEFGYTYSLGGALTSQTYPSGKIVDFEYDLSGDLSEVSKRTSNGSFIYANSFEYAPHGKVEKVRLGNGKWETTQFNSDRQITQIGLGHSATDAGLLKIDYEYGSWEGQTLNPQKNNGNLARQTITVPTIGSAAGFTAVQTYIYDPLDRIRSATEKIGGNDTWKQTFLYDRFGNRNFDVANTTLQSVDSTVAKVTNPEILAASNKLKEDQDNDGQPDYQYDQSGNLTRDARGQQFTYNAENLQVAATGTGVNVSYSYDGNNKRVKTYDAVNDRTTIFVYDANGALAAEYTINVEPPDVPVISYLTEDALGSVRVTTNSFGEVKARRDFLPFGEELYAGLAGRNANQKYSSNTDNLRKKFATYQRDTETGLDFAQSRYYSPMHGRFTSPDEFKGGPDELFDFEEDASDNPTFYADLKNPQSLNKYQYGYNNPYKYNDPTGHCPLCVAAVAAAIFIIANPDTIGPRQPQTTAEVIGDVAGILPIPGTKLVGGAIARAIIGGATKTVVKQTTKQVVKESVKQTTKQTTKQAQKSVRSIQKQIAKHKQKLADYKKNPDKHDHQGRLRNVSSEIRQKRIQGRINKLEKEINKFENEIEKKKRNQ